MEVSPAYLPGGEIPEAMGIVGDLLKEVEELRLAFEKGVVEKLKAREHELREHLIANLEKSREGGGDTGAVGRKYRVQIKDKEAPRVPKDNWPLFYAYVQRTGRFDLLQKRLSDKAVLEMKDAGQLPDGIEVALIPTISLTKV